MHKKLTESDVRTIVATIEVVGRLELAKTYGISPTSISAIMSGLSWGHITGIKRKITPSNLAKKMSAAMHDRQTVLAKMDPTERRALVRMPPVAWLERPLPKDC